MLTRAFTKPTGWRSPKDDDETSCRTVSIYEYEDCIFGFMDIDVPLVFCDGGDPGRGQLTLREVLRWSAGVMGGGRLGMTEKVVVGMGKVCAVKRFQKVTVRRREFGRRVQLLAGVSRWCRYLVPVTAYLYAKRIKFVVCDYYPMGSLADLLAGARELGHTALSWKQRLKITHNIARALAFIHSQSPPTDKHLQMNVHGNVKTSNVMINIDFTACLSDYGMSQLAQRVEVPDTGQQTPPSQSPLPPSNDYCDMVSQKSDIYNFGIVILDMVGGPTAPSLRHCISERIGEIKDGLFPFFEAPLEGKEKIQALRVLEIALDCTSSSPTSRPNMEKLANKVGKILDGIR